MTQTLTRDTAWRALAIATAIALTLSLAFLARPVSADPPGNNGTVKIDGIEFDDHPDNEPHPGCVFQVDFYGYDEGDLYASVLFEAWPPTGAGDGDVLLFEEDIFIGEDDNSGGGSEAGLDASRTYDLSGALAGYDRHPVQGYHIKLTVHADGSQGNDRKHKVFWIECEEGEEELGSVLVAKVDEENEPLGGATFEIDGVAHADTDGDGFVCVDGLELGSMVEIVETIAPDGFIGDDEPQTVTVISTLACEERLDGATVADADAVFVNVLEGEGPGEEEVPREGTQPGAGGPGQVPDTATVPAPSGSVPAALLALVMLTGLGAAGYAMQAEARRRR